ncbi:facilitated trehalose transporter Tret1-like isoform X2 [Macrosteles quadrilineatus]|nr:facilitated trehalose transporter Tret1-like isoform X2 [Macrosteles quadrilineatus]
MAYSAILLPQLMSPDSTLRVTTNEASWIASLMAISTPVGTLLCGPFMDLLGRKVFSLVTVVPLAASWFILTFTPNHVWFIYAARVLAGFGGGLTTVSLVYISEISSASWRPMLLCLNSVFVSLGILLTNVLGVLLPWRVVSLICGCITLASGAAILLYNPESPYWLLTFRPDSTRHFDEAKRSLRYLYNNQQMFTAEWDRLVKVSKAKRQEQEAAQEGRRNGLVGNVRHFSREFTKREVILPFSLLLTIFFFQQLSGTYPIIFYAVQVFQSIGGDFGAGLNADSATVILGVIRFSVSLLTTSLSRSFGRRFLLIVSGVGMTISSFAAALYFHRTCVFKSVFDVTESSFNSTFLNTTTEMNVTSTLSPSTTGSSLLGLVFILVFVIMSSIGFLIIPWTLVGEILPVTVRATGGGIVFSYAYILMFGIVKVFPYMLSVLKISGLFYFFCFTSFANVVIVYFFLPETLGKSFEEIEKSFMKTHNNS